MIPLLVNKTHPLPENYLDGVELWEKVHRRLPEFGFILRYPKGKEEITGYGYEPWHIRYVGKELARKVYDSGLCLEEYLGEQ